MKNAGVNGYINSLYRNVLLREASEEETNFWAGQVAQGMSSASLAEVFVVSEEAQKVKMVLRLYDVFFDRSADIGGLQYWLDRFKTEDSLDDMARAFVASSEFQEAYGSRSDADYVEAVYGNLFERETDAAGKAYWVERLSNGEVDRCDLALALAFSDEALSRDGAATRFAESYLALRSASIEEPQTEVVEALARTSLAEAIAQLQTVTGTAQNGILRNAQVSRDSDGDGVPDTVSTTVSTGENGQFTVHGGYGSILVQGGYDLTTGRYNDKILSAPGSKLIDDEAALHQKIVVTPLTTLVAAMVSKGMSLGDAVQKVKVAFVLEDATDPLVFDHTGVAISKTATLEEQQEAVTVKGLAAQLSVIMENVAGVISGAAGRQLGMDIPKLTTWVSSVLADAVLKAGTGADGAAASLAASLASKDFLSDVIKNAADEFAKAHPSAISADAMAKLSDLADEAAMAIGNLNSVIQQSVDAYAGGEKPGVTAIDAISAIAKAESLGQGPMQDALTSGVAGGNLSGVLTSYSGTSLTTAIKQIEIGLIAEGVGSTSGGSVLDGATGGGAEGGGGSSGGGGNGGGSPSPGLPDGGSGSEGGGNEGSTKQAPWTLLMTYDYGSYVLGSDGTAKGTSKLVNNLWGSKGLAVNEDQTHAVIYGYHGDGSQGLAVFGTDGTLDQTILLSDGLSFSQNMPIVFGNTFAFIGENGLVTDGTVSGSHSLDEGVSVDYILEIDSEQQVVWYSNYSAPYGEELYRAVIQKQGIANGLVKDINPGTGSGVESYYSEGSTGTLPDGKFLFPGYFNLYEKSLWVSDGSEGGTKRIASSDFDRIGSPSQLTKFGDKIALVGNYYKDEEHWGYSTELIITDGTGSGTTVLEVSPESDYFYPQILGVIEGNLYFTATGSDSSGNSTKSIFSTDGVDVANLVDISNEALLLGWNNEIAYFRLSDPLHGEELWAADLNTGAFGLVEDILPGSGSALARHGEAFMFDGKLAFTAYTSASTERFFLSDGTSTGTVEIGGSVPIDKAAVENALYFADKQGVHVIHVGAQESVLIHPDSGMYSYQNDTLQSDSDQAFFLASDGVLYASQGSSETTFQLASNIGKFKVVAEDAIYALQEIENQAYLWFSDGTANGTYCVTQLEGNAFGYDLGNAVAVKTSVMPPSLQMSEGDSGWDGVF